MIKYLSRYILLCFIFLLIINISFVKAQTPSNYPVSVTPVIYPPYPTSIKYLYASTAPSLVLTITNKSATPSLLTVNIAMVIQAKDFTATSKPVVAGLAPITLTGGSPVRLTNLDISALFDFNNLTGLTLSQYENAFPQSKIVFGFVLYDAVTGRQVSDNVTYSVAYSVNYPPTTFAPGNNSTVVEKGFQNILFQWQPRQSAPANSVQYTFEMVELFDATQDPNSAFLTNKPFYTDSTFSNRLIYGEDLPPLLPGKVYVWRVQAKTYDNGGSFISNFQNNGYSNNSSFKYFANCKSPTMLEVNDISKSAANVTWASMPEYENFVFSYRKKGDANWKDYPVKGLSDPLYALSALQSLTTYEVKVKTLCDDGSNAVSVIKEFKTTNTEASATTKKINASCGTRPPAKDRKKDLLSTLKTSDKIIAGDYTIEVTDVTGQNGIFSGKGIVEVWIGKAFKMKVAFDKIKVNKDFEMIDGKVTTEKL